jgi:hypothetical protein
MNTFNYHPFSRHSMTDQGSSRVKTVDPDQIKQAQKEKNFLNLKQNLKEAGLAPPPVSVV